MTGFMIAFAFLLTAQASSTTGSIIGCMEDAIGQRLPGVTVIVTSDGIRLTTVGDRSGCYELKDVPRGAYRVTARLPGFNNVTHDRVAVSGATVTRLDFTMRVSSICECLWLGGQTLAQQWDYADLVVHVRLSESGPAPAARSGYYRHVATVLNALKLPSGGVIRGQMSVLQNQESGHREPYDVGQEAVLFLKSWDGDLVITNDNPGLKLADDEPAATAFLIENGRIDHAPPGFRGYVGRQIAVFLDELRELSRRR